MIFIREGQGKYSPKQQEIKFPAFPIMKFWQDKTTAEEEHEQLHKPRWYTDYYVTAACKPEAEKLHWETKNYEEKTVA